MSPVLVGSWKNATRGREANAYAYADGRWAVVAGGRILFDATCENHAEAIRMAARALEEDDG